jgi:hypothetical protein
MVAALRSLRMLPRQREPTAPEKRPLTVGRYLRLAMGSLGIRKFCKISMFHPGWRRPAVAGVTISLLSLREVSRGDFCS